MTPTTRKPKSRPMTPDELMDAIIAQLAASKNPRVSAWANCFAADEQAAKPGAGRRSADPRKPR